MTTGSSFEPVLMSLKNGDVAAAPGAAGGDTCTEVRRVIICSGKIAVELEAKRAELAGRDPECDAASTAIVRVEELAPWPTDRVAAALS